MILITSEPIDILEVVESVKDPAAGGIDLFVGTSREHSHGRAVLSLEYEAYVPMATECMNRIASRAAAQWPVRKISIVHRVGTVVIGEASVAIAVSASHRKEAFEACRYVIDSLKQEVPIWKKERFADGEVWVGMEGGRDHPK